VGSAAKHDNGNHNGWNKGTMVIMYKVMAKAMGG